MISGLLMASSDSLQPFLIQSSAHTHTHTRLSYSGTQQGCLFTFCLFICCLRSICDRFVSTQVTQHCYSNQHNRTEK